ncbi:MAG: hypothetical protein JEZ06_22865 [Anaerolineaceae bacterium]|nr:hypothetical protein [Anaerolineaceae bacterium]
MKNKLNYSFQAFQKDHFWLPLALMALFLIIIMMISDSEKYNAARAFIGFTLPLISGGLASYAFLEDQALEMQFTMQRALWKLILERLGIILLITILTAVIFQICAHFLGISLSPLGNIFKRQLVWLIPCTTTLVLGGWASLMGRSSSAGLSVIGGIWIIQLLARGWFIRDSIFRNILLFYGVMDPFGTPLLANQLVLISITILLLLLSYFLLQKHERYI